VDKKTRIERRYFHQAVGDKRSSRLQGLTWKPENKRDGRNRSEYGFYRDTLHLMITKFAGSCLSPREIGYVWDRLSARLHSN
jgi:hypothetical protein